MFSQSTFSSYNAVFAEPVSREVEKKEGAMRRVPAGLCQSRPWELGLEGLDALRVGHDQGGAGTEVQQK